MIPKINDKPKYEVTVPSTGQEVRFRPYLVKEERVLLSAFESKDKRNGLRAIVDTLVACIDEEIDPDKLTLYDVEYLFTMVRSKSVGESSAVKINCKYCDHMNDYVLSVDNISIDKESGNRKIQINDEISVEMRHPRYLDVINNDHLTDAASREEKVIYTIKESMVAIYTETDRIAIKDEPEKDVIEFIESLSSKQFQSLYDFILNGPKLKFVVEFECAHCEKENKFEIRETKDFF